MTGVLVYGILNFGTFYALAYLAFREVPAGTGQVILGLVPLLTLGLAVIHRVERFRWLGLAGALIAAGGIAVIFADRLGGDISLASLVLVLLAGIVVGEAGVAVKWFPRAHPVHQNLIGLHRWTVSATSYTFLLIPLVTVVAGAILGERISPAFVAGGALVLAGTYVGAFLRPADRSTR